MRTIVLLLTFLCLAFAGNAQKVIKMRTVGGVSIIPCKVNGLSLSFIFDTGAGDVSISMTEASFMLKNNYLSSNDFRGTQQYRDANGDISEGIKINLKEVEIAGLKLFNVEASIVNNLSAPLLLGQSAISKLGIIQLDLQSNTLTILDGKSSYDFASNFTMKSSKKVELGEMFSLTLNINEKGQDLQLPDLPDFDVMMGPSISQNPLGFTYIFILKPKRIGHFTINPASIYINEIMINSNPLSIDVVKVH